MPDASKYYVSNYVDSTITCISIGAPACRNGDELVATKTINLLLGGASLGNYNPDHRRGIHDLGRSADSDTGESQRKVRHHGRHADGTITIIDTGTDELVKVLPCSAGCHGVNFGAKKGGGYYAYVASKFSNDLIVVDPDPNDDGNVADAAS